MALRSVTGEALGELEGRGDAVRRGRGEEAAGEETAGEEGEGEEEVAGPAGVGAGVGAWTGEGVAAGGAAGLVVAGEAGAAECVRGSL